MYSNFFLWSCKQVVNSFLTILCWLMCLRMVKRCMLRILYNCTWFCVKKSKISNKIGISWSICAKIWSATNYMKLQLNIKIHQFPLVSSWGTVSKKFWRHTYIHTFIHVLPCMDIVYYLWVKEFVWPKAWRFALVQYNVYAIC